MSKKMTPVEQMTVEIRNELLTVLVPCKTRPFHFSPGVKVAPVAKAIGITDPTLRSFAEGASVSLSTLSKIRAYLDRRADESTAETTA
jgi:hypothetical protein